MPLPQIKLGNISISKLILGGNPFSGFSHQTPEKDWEMKSYYTTARIKAMFQQAESLGINTHLGRADHHVMRVLLEYWNEGGTIQWIAQTCPEVGTIDRGVQNAINGKAKACFIHGGEMDYRFANKQLDEVPFTIKKIREAGMPAGIAGHNPAVFEWAEQHLDVDFYMCSYYNAAHRDEHKEHISGMPEWFDNTDREKMVKLIRRLSKPVIHYKVLAAGRNKPEEAFRYVAQHLRLQDAVCVGVYTKDNPQMLEEDILLLGKYLIEIRGQKLEVR
ncbi:MAG: hypothetical protein ACE14V_08505 [bacterium]